MGAAVSDRPPVAIVGAGITGLACADALRDVAEVTVVDRIPVPGGVHGWDAGETRRLAQARAARACSWARRRSAGTAGAAHDRARTAPTHLTAAALVIAAGARPLGRAELRHRRRPPGRRRGRHRRLPPGRERPAGGPPRRPIVAAATGRSGPRASCARLVPSGPTLVCPTGCCARRPADDPCTCASTTASCGAGSPRVSTATLDSGESLGCDAVVLAHGLAPLRNVDGAVSTASARSTRSRWTTRPRSTGARRPAAAAAAADGR